MINDEIVCIENLLRDEKTFNIRWFITSLCNYECDFCIQGDRGAHMRRAQGESAEIRKRICSELRKTLDGVEDYERIKVDLIGGEVTVLPEFPEILRTLSESSFEKSIRFHITTNLSQSAEYYCRLWSLMQTPHAGGKRELHVSASFYSAYTTMEEFCEKIVFILDHAPSFKNKYSQKLWSRVLASGVRVKQPNSILTIGCPILNDTDYRDMLEMRKRLKNYGVTINPIIIRQYKTDVSQQIRSELSREEEKKEGIRVTDIYGKTHVYRNIRMLGADLDDREMFCPRGYCCDAGIDGFSVNALGGVSRCPVEKAGRSGNLLDGSYHRISAPRRCDSEHCSCLQFGRILKTENP